MERKKLPGSFEERYKSNYLKEQIMGFGLWDGLQGAPKIDSPEGIRRLQKNNLLFTFIDRNFPNGPYAFEPNMKDHRFVMVPANVHHQGIGLCVSDEFPGFLEVGQFWYPEEFKKKGKGIGIDQVYVRHFSSTPDEKQLIELIRKLYIEEKSPPGVRFCTFAFLPKVVVGLKGNFLDDVDKAEKVIRDRLKNCNPTTQQCGETLILFMKMVGTRKNS